MGLCFICLPILMLVSPENIFTDMPTVLPTSRAYLGPVKQYKTKQSHWSSQGTMSTKSLLPQVLVTRTGICLGSLNSSDIAPGALLRGTRQCSDTQEEWVSSSWGKACLGQGAPPALQLRAEFSQTRHVIQHCWWRRLKLHLAVKAPAPSTCLWQKPLLYRSSLKMKTWCWFPANLNYLS